MLSFKENDFVRYIHSNTSKPLKISNINCGRYYFEGTNMSCLEYEITPWTPEPGEWVIPDTGVNEDMFVIMKYNGISLIPNRCQPFIGELPDCLQI